MENIFLWEIVLKPEELGSNDARGFLPSLSTFGLLLGDHCLEVRSVKIELASTSAYVCVCPSVSCLSLVLLAGPREVDVRVCELDCG